MNRWAILSAALLSLFFGCTKPGQNFPSETRTVLGVPVTVTFFVEQESAQDLRSAFEDVFGTLQWFESATLASGEQNQLSKIAGGAGRESVPVDSAVYDMLMRGLQLNDLTGGAFDLRYGPLLDAWLASGSPSRPDQALLDSALSLIKTGGMFVAGRSILLSKPSMRFDVRGFVDAWAIDRAADKLAKRGLTAFEIRTPYAARVVGMPANTQSRNVQLGDPQGGQEWATLSMSQGGMAYLPSSGPKDALGQARLVLDPRSGEKANTSTVVLSKDCATAYGLAVALAIEEEAALSDKARAELLGSIRITGEKPGLSIAAEGALKDRLKTLN
ncbi:MAG: FAD:protein FMN transferase [Calditrichaeota bacterium]|nr:FAD:protein FMN transferase [Calditrichota bacterium]MCB9366292.1 FAD:protein FMN transferase [Calditrichota bacterium]